MWARAWLLRRSTCEVAGRCDLRATGIGPPLEEFCGGACVRSGWPTKNPMRFATVVFTKWQVVAGVLVSVAAGVVIAAVLIGRALRWKGTLEELKRKAGRK